MDGPTIGPQQLGAHMERFVRFPTRSRIEWPKDDEGTTFVEPEDQHYYEDESGDDDD